jgi:ABC-2 type transport system permease protein
MKFLKMIGFEIRNILKSKFLLIIGILVVLASIAIPVIGKLTTRNPNDPNGRPIPYMMAYSSKAEAYYGYGGGSGQDPITVDGITITIENPFYWNIQNLMQQKDSLNINKAQYTTPEAMDLASDFMDIEIQYYVKMAQYITTPQDYRMSLVYQSNDSLTDKFIYEHNDVDPDVLLQAISFQKGMDPETFKKMYIDITPEARQAAYIKVDGMLNQTYDVIQNNDFPKFIALSIQQQNDQIDSIKANIAIQEQAIIDNPSQEENISPMIEDMKKQITLIQTNNIPLLQYRLDKNILPGLVIWQNAALDDISNNRNQLAYTTIMSQDDFMKNPDMLREFKSYQKYKDKTQKQIDDMNNNVLIAQNSLDAGKPDMKYVSSGSRSQTVVFLNYSAIIALFGVLLGGWIIASEFQQGTIRLLMIRPKTRVKILMSKFAGAFVVCLALYAAGSLLNILANGICYGFSDYAFPNYSISGPISFFIYYLPKFLACIVPVLFGFSFAFMLSTVVKNMAVSIAVPVVCYVGCIIALAISINRPSLAWIGWTPAPYAWLSLFYTPGYSMQFIQNGFELNIPYGIGLLLVLTAICISVSIIVFKKRDIAN